MNEKVITIFGTGKTKPGEKIYQIAFELGSELAKAGFTIANGGYDGTMLAAADGANAQNGKVIGVTCKAFKKSKANRFVNREIKTSSLTERLEQLIKIGDGFVVLPGRTGTLLELAEVWELKNKHFISKPIVLLGNFWKPIIQLMTKTDPKAADCLQIAENVKQVKNIICQNIGV